MKDILSAPFLIELTRTLTNMYNHGWDERNSGNLSLLLDESDIKDYCDTNNFIREFNTGFETPLLDNKYFIVTGTGKYFKNVQYDPALNLGLVKILDNGRKARLLWGLTDGGNLTSEFPAHMMSHSSRLAIDSQNRVILHCHATNLLAMTYVHEFDEKKFTRTLWQMATESIIIFPDGINILPWMLCGTNEIGQATAEKFKSSRLVLWAMHGLYAAGKNLDDAFGLIETAEKAAEIFLKTAHLPRVNNITDENLKSLAVKFNVKPREGYLSLQHS